MLVIVLVVLALSFAYPLRGWFDQRAQLSALNERTIAQQLKIAEIRSDLTRWDDPAFVETQARNRLRFVMPGEASFVVLGGEVAADDTARTADELSATGSGTGLSAAAAGGAWWERLWSTVDQADASVSPDTTPVSPDSTTPSVAPTTSATPSTTPSTAPPSVTTSPPTTGGLSPLEIATDAINNGG